MIKKISLLIALLALMACGQKMDLTEVDKPAAPEAVGQAEFDAAYQAAEAAREQAAGVEYEWNTIAPLLQQASDAAAAGDYAQGIRLASEAQKHGELAYAQAEHEAQNWQGAVIQ